MDETTGWSVSVEDGRIVVTDPKGAARSLALADLRAVAIETTDQGPFGPDLFWLLFGPDERVAIAFPQQAAGEAKAAERFMALPGFDFEAMVQAMGSTERAFFPVWRG